VPSVSPHRLGLCLFLFALTTLSWSADPTPGVELRWFSSDGGELWRVPLGDTSTPVRQTAPTPLMAEVWFKPLPDIEVPLMDGGAYSLHDDGAGKVVILDFWATWCAPCKDELPTMQALYMALRDEGLDAIAVNADEPIEVAKPYAMELGLTMPLGSYSKEFKEAFLFSTLPLFNWWRLGNVGLAASRPGQSLLQCSMSSQREC